MAERPVRVFIDMRNNFYLAACLLLLLGNCRSNNVTEAIPTGPVNITLDLNLLDKTTYETKLLLTAKNIDKEVVDSILKVLNHSDMVKFAASKPGEEIVEKSFFMIRQLIVETSPIEYQHAE